MKKGSVIFSAVKNKSKRHSAHESMNAVKVMHGKTYIHCFFTHDKEIVLFKELYKKLLK